jgi:hypothetical protein
MSKTFSQADVAAHNKPNDLYVTIDEDVYDLTTFQDEHPGISSLPYLIPNSSFGEHRKWSDAAMAQAERRSSPASPAKTPRSSSGNTTMKAS